MTAYIWTRPTARKCHYCGICRRVILAGEDYDRMFGADGGVWTFKCCRHCYRVAQAHERWSGEYEWTDDQIIEFVSEYHPALNAQMLAGWRYPDCEVVPLPFPHHCHECWAEIPDDRLWCQPCDIARIDRLSHEFDAIADQFEKAEATS